MSKKIIWFNKLTGVKGEAAQISHVAIRIVLGSPEGYVIESTTFNKWAGKSGFQENPYYQWLRCYHGRVWYRDLTLEQCYSHPLTKEFLKENFGKKYESGIPGAWELLLAGLRLHRVPSINQLHCSESNILFLQKHRLFSDMALPNNYPPHTFWKGGVVEIFLRNCTIGDCVRIK